MEKKTGIQKLYSVVTFAGTLVLMNFMFLISCIPVVTIGQAWCALLSAVRYNIRGDKWFDGFKAGFKKRFWRGLLSWCILLPVNAYLLIDVHHYYAGGYLEPLISSCFVFLLTAMVTTALIILNVYIPTSVKKWISNAVGLVFKAPLQLAAATALWVVPVILAMLWPLTFFYIIMVFIAVYFAVVALVTTLSLKRPLMDLLLSARADGSLLAEEGKTRLAKEGKTENETMG